MAAILPSNGGNSEGLGDIEEKFSQEDSLVFLVSLVFTDLQLNTQNSSLNTYLPSAIRHQLLAISSICHKL